jgi:hypothetical protein
MQWSGRICHGATLAWRFVRRSYCGNRTDRALCALVGISSYDEAFCSRTCLRAAACERIAHRRAQRLLRELRHILREQYGARSWR